MLSFDNLNSHPGSRAAINIPLLMNSCFSCSPRTRCDALLPCGHTCQLLGHDDDIEHISTNQCQEICNSVAPCGHICISICHVEDMQHQHRYKCPIKCDGVMACGHRCKVNNSKKKRKKRKKNKHGCKNHKPCAEKCGKWLPCGHECLLVCHASTPEHAKCPQCNTIVPPSESSTSQCPSTYAVIAFDASSKMLANDCSLGIFKEQEHFKAVKPVTNLFGQEKNHSKPPSKDQTEIQHFQSNIKPGKIIEMYIPSGHKCLKVDNICSRVCKTVLFCGHQCALVCNMHQAPEGPRHAASEKCNFCSKSDAMWKELSQICHIKDSSLSHCSHLVKHFQCEEICPGRPCGHPCDVGKPHHTCLDHVALNKVRCSERCPVRLSCGHMCTKLCHLGSYKHNCSTKKCCKKIAGTDVIFKEKQKITANQIDLQKMNPRSCKTFNMKANNGTLESDSEHRLPNIKTGHICCKNKKACSCQCDYLFDCKHVCTKRCHVEDSKHRPAEKCDTCVRNKHIQRELCVEGIEHPEGTLYTYCSHYEKSFNCERVCTGRLCGHPCGKKLKKKSHSCLDHAANYKCMVRCDVVLACRHKCAKICHLGDASHLCEECQKEPEESSNKSITKTENVGTHKPKPELQKSLIGFSCDHGWANHQQLVVHNSTEKCRVCSQTDALKQKFADLGIKLPAGHPQHCVHYVPLDQCQMICEGQLCGHPCGSFTKGHVCSEHITCTSLKPQCRRHCEVWLSCGHQCSKQCHIGDYSHECAVEDCSGSVQSMVTADYRDTNSIPIALLSDRFDDNKQLGFLSKAMENTEVEQESVGCYAPEQTVSTSFEAVPKSALESYAEVLKISLKENQESLKDNDKVLESDPGLEPKQVGKGHTCDKHESDKCPSQSGYLFECNHICVKQFHNDASPHQMSKRCDTCVRNDDICRELIVRGIKHSKGELYTHCAHYEKNFKCERVCTGRLCGHPCGKKLKKKSHSCLDHAANYKCMATCDVVLACRHKCAKLCHLGDAFHLCEDCKTQKESPRESLSNASELDIKMVDTNKPCKVELQKSYTTFSCGHSWFGEQHEPLHSTNKCRVCTQADALKQKFADFGIELQSGPFQHCLHCEKLDQCQMVCAGRICGHPCGSKFRKGHVCSDHVTCTSLKKRRCGRLCDVWLSCGHRCSKKCHIDDDSHECVREGCSGPVNLFPLSASTFSESEFNDGNEVGLISRQHELVENENETDPKTAVTGFEESCHEPNVESNFDVTESSTIESHHVSLENIAGTGQYIGSLLLGSMHRRNYDVKSPFAQIFIKK